MSPQLVPHSTSSIDGAGIEDLTLNLNDSAGLFCAVFLEQAWGRWFRNVEVRNSNSHQLFLANVSASEIRHCYTNSTKSGGPSHEGIDLEEDCCWNLIEDNIIYNGGFSGIFRGDSRGGCQGNVIAYNYCGGVDVGSPETGGADISFSHGPHNVLNLALIYRLGYPNMGNTDYDGTSFGPTTPANYASMSFISGEAQELDLNVKASLLRHGNYDYANNAVVWEPAIPERILPFSLFRSAKPAWFGDRAWPPIDPAHPENCTIASIPAGYRFVRGTEPPRDLNPAVERSADGAPFCRPNPGIKPVPTGPPGRS